MAGRTRLAGRRMVTVVPWPATLSIVTSAFKAGPERNKAVGMWGAMGALGGSSGSLLGGVLTQGLGWPAMACLGRTKCIHSRPSD